VHLQASDYQSAQRQQLPTAAQLPRLAIMKRADAYNVKSPHRTRRQS